MATLYIILFFCLVLFLCGVALFHHGCATIGEAVDTLDVCDTVVQFVFGLFYIGASLFLATLILKVGSHILPLQ